MITLLSETLCIACDMCVKICPTNVFDRVAGDVPVIARQEDCQTCFICEAYCPADALYVSPESDRPVPVSEKQLIDNGSLGEYRRILGWGPGRTNRSDQDTAHLLRTLRGPFRDNA
jgi:formate hydrogenlyase subunit 6/NADH:ubiquinone oxidoreductase subunit I